MYRGHTIGVVVPAYNEEDHVGDVIRSFPAYVDRAYVVDDGSTDDTWAEMRRVAEAINGDPSTKEADKTLVVTIRHSHNKGVGAAIKTGYKRALADDIDVATVMGGDGQMDPDKLELLLDPIVDGRADYAKGNRLVRPEDREGMPRFRLFGNLLLTLLTKVSSGYWSVGDPQNGYTAISAAALDAVELDDMYEYYGYCNDLLVKLNVSGQRVADVRIPAEYGDETSHISYIEYVPRVSLMLLRNFAWRLRRQLGDGTAPGMAVSYLLGLALIVVGLVLGLTAVAAGSDLVLAPVAVLAGLLGISVGLRLDYDSDATGTVRIDHADLDTGQTD